jgi:hypothetical protein
MDDHHLTPAGSALLTERFGVAFDKAMTWRASRP